MHVGSKVAFERRLTYTLWVDDSRPTWPGTPPGKPPSVPPKKRCLALYVEGTEVLLEDGEKVLGRSPSCDIVIDDMLASRVHAKLTVTEGAVILRDLGSANGVYVNSTRVDMPTPLRDGDRILIGTKEMSIFAVRVAGKSAESSGMHRLGGLSVKPVSSGPRAINPAHARAPSERAHAIRSEARHMPRTEKSDAFTHLGLLAQRMLDTGRVDGAIRVLAEHMRNVMDGSRDGRPVPDDVLASSSRFAMTFAAAKLEAKWVDYVVELHMNVRRPMQAELIDSLISLRRKNVVGDRDLLLFYKATLQREEPNLSLPQRVLCARIFSLGDP